MRKWKKRLFYKRMGILLTVAGYLFFFFFLIDIKRMMIYVQLPLITYVEDEAKSTKDIFFEAGMLLALPLSVYASESGEWSISTEDQDTLQLLLNMQESEKPYADSESVIEQMEQENESAKESVSQNQADKEPAEEGTEDREEQTGGAAEGVPEPEAERETEGEGADEEKEHTDGTDLQPIEPEKLLDMDKYQDFDTLLKTFYILDANTYIDASELNLDKLYHADLTIEKLPQNEQGEGDGETEETVDYSLTTNPQILIYHTHSQEGYADSVEGDDSTTVMGVGEELARILSQQYGFRVLHHKGKYDVKSRDYAYSEAAPGIEEVLKQNPSIEVVIDLHRDGVAAGTHLVTKIDGRPTAQVMLFNGLSRTKKIGEISYLKNENIDGNLAFSFQLQKKMMEYYPGFARRIYLKGYRYNMHYKPRSLLVELGAQTNTREEVWNALPPLAHCIAMVLEGE